MLLDDTHIALYLTSRFSNEGNWMYLDISHLNEFYDQPLGQTVQENANKTIQKFWPTLSDRRLLGLGYAIPFISQYLKDSERIIAGMPAAQGVVHWPEDEKNLTILTEDEDMPFEDSSIDNVLVVHGLEMTQNPLGILNEIWRILTPSGRMIVLVANRRGLWSKFESTPFGYGHSYSRGQLSTQLIQCDFRIVNIETILHYPPVSNPSLSNTGKIVENLGSNLWPRLGGLIAIDAEKSVLKPITVHKEQNRAMRILKPSFAPG